MLYDESSDGRNLRMTRIELPDRQAAALEAKAAAQGLSLQAWLAQLAQAAVPAANTTRSGKTRAAAQAILNIQKRTKPDPEGMTIRDYIDFGRKY
jgi:hypothetical protein